MSFDGCVDPYGLSCLLCSYNGSDNLSNHACVNFSLSLFYPIIDIKYVTFTPVLMRVFSFISLAKVLVIKTVSFRYSTNLHIAIRWSFSWPRWTLFAVSWKVQVTGILLLSVLWIVVNMTMKPRVTMFHASISLWIHGFAFVNTGLDLVF